MKTLIEAAQEYAESQGYDTCDYVTKKDFEEYARTDFYAGVEFAQRWIPIKEEMPKEFPILTKDLFGTIDVFRSLTERMASAFDIVSWRPIEIK